MNSDAKKRRDAWRATAKARVPELKKLKSAALRDSQYFGSEGFYRLLTQSPDKVRWERPVTTGAYEEFALVHVSPEKAT